MKFENVLKKVKVKTETIDAAGIGFLAVQVTLTDKDAGIFYVEVKDGMVTVEPYEYNDRQANITMTNENFCKLMNGKFDADQGLASGKIEVDGDNSKALELFNIVK